MLVFGWVFDIMADGIVRTDRATESDAIELKLKRPDHPTTLWLEGAGTP